MVSRYENVEELMSKFLAGEATPEEAMLLEDWKNESSSNMAIYKRCVKLFKVSGGADLELEPDAERAWKAVKRATLEVGRVRKMLGGALWLRIAALLVLALGVTMVMRLFVFMPDNGEMVIASGNSDTAVTLKDRSVVHVLANSSVVVEEGFGKSNRRLKLKGSAYFEVVHKDKEPFVVDAGKVFIKDIGTKFSVTSSVNDDTVFVKVDEGVVLLFDSIGARIEIKATERALYIKSSKQIITPKGTELSGGKISFANTSLGEVIARLSDSYSVSITLENSQLANCTLTTQFENEDIETVLTVISETLGLSFEKSGESYILKGEVCK